MARSFFHRARKRCKWEHDDHDHRETVVAFLSQVIHLRNSAPKIEKTLVSLFVSLFIGRGLQFAQVKKALRLVLC